PTSGWLAGAKSPASRTAAAEIRRRSSSRGLTIPPLGAAPARLHQRTSTPSRPRSAGCSGPAPTFRPSSKQTTERWSGRSRLRRVAERWPIGIYNASAAIEAATCGVRSMSDRDDAAAAYCELAENREPAGTARKRSVQPRRLTTHVPIRFSAAVIERVKELAADDGKTVSSWIRDLVEREVLLREQPRTVGVMPRLRWERRPTPN